MLPEAVTSPKAITYPYEILSQYYSSRREEISKITKYVPLIVTVTVK
jgi:hypothetical protein